MLSYLWKIYLTCIREASQKLKSCWCVLFGLIALGMGFIAINLIASQLGILGAFLRSIYEAVAISYYLGWLREATQYKKVKFADLKSFDWGLFQSVISILFILYLVHWGVTMLSTGMDGAWIFYILQLLFVVLLNSLPETLYLRSRDGMDGIQESFSFTTRNWIEWYLPYLIVISPLVLTGGRSIAAILAQTHIFFPGLALITVPSYLFPELEILVFPLGLALSHWFMLFRAKLYQELDTGSRRQRMFKNRM